MLSVLFAGRIKDGVVGGFALIKEHGCDHAEGPLSPLARTRQYNVMFLGKSVLGVYSVIGAMIFAVCTIWVKT